MAQDGRILKSMILVNQVKLVSQTQTKLELAIEGEKIGLHCGSLGNYDEGNEVTVASIQTVKKLTPFVHLLIIDEAHNAENSKDYTDFIARLREKNPKLKVVRFTATPFTAQGGYIFGKDKPLSLIHI